MSVVESEGLRSQLLSGRLCIRLLRVLSPRICTFEIALGRNPTKMCSNGQITAKRNVSVVCYMHITHMCTNFLILVLTGRSLC